MKKGERKVTHFALEFSADMISKLPKSCFIRHEPISNLVAQKWLIEPELVFCFRANERTMIDGVLQWLGNHIMAKEVWGWIEKGHTSKTVRSYHSFRPDFDRGLLVIQLNGETPTASELAEGIKNGTYKFFLYRIFE